MLTKQKNGSNSDAVCRICYQSDGSMIEPCRCKGSVAKVHRHCIQTWLHYNQEKVSCEMCSFQYKVKRPYNCGFVESFNIYQESEISAYDAIDIWLLITRMIFNIMDSVLLFPSSSYYAVLSIQFSLFLTIVYLSYRIQGENYEPKCTILGLLFFLSTVHPLNCAVLKLFAPHEFLLSELNENVIMSKIFGPFIRILLTICETGQEIHRRRKLNVSWMKYGAIALIIFVTIQRMIFFKLAINEINTNLDPELLLDSIISYVLDFILLSFAYSSYKIIKFGDDWLEWHDTTEFVICDLK